MAWRAGVDRDAVPEPGRLRLAATRVRGAADTASPLCERVVALVQQYGTCEAQQRLRARAALRSAQAEYTGVQLAAMRLCAERAVLPVVLELLTRAARQVLGPQVHRPEALRDVLAARSRHMTYRAQATRVVARALVDERAGVGVMLAAACPVAAAPEVVELLAALVWHV